MEFEDLFASVFFIGLAISLFLIFFKIYSLKDFQRRHKQYLRLKILTFYKEEHINSTTSFNKRDFMITGNWLTIIIYLFLFPTSVFLMINLVLRIKDFLGIN
jgi:hypothetical protein